MTEKRFTFVDLGETWAISVDNECKYYMHLVDNCTTVVELLNSLSDENEQLKQEKKQLQIKANEFVELYERDFGKTYDTPPRHGKTVRPQLWIVRKILDELGILELYGDVE